MENEAFVYDTYALIEILKSNENYEAYLDNKRVINAFIFAEFCYHLIKDKVNNKETYLDRLKEFVVEIDPEIIRKAMEFRYKNKRKKLSMTDCISYFYG